MVLGSEDVGPFCNFLDISCPLGNRLVDDEATTVQILINKTCLWLKFMSHCFITINLEHSPVCQRGYENNQMSVSSKASVT